MGTRKNQVDGSGACNISALQKMLGRYVAIVIVAIGALAIVVGLTGPTPTGISAVSGAITVIPMKRWCFIPMVRVIGCRSATGLPLIMIIIVMATGYISLFIPHMMRLTHSTAISIL